MDEIEAAAAGRRASWSASSRAVRRERPIEDDGTQRDGLRVPLGSRRGHLRRRDRPAAASRLSRRHSDLSGRHLRRDVAAARERALRRATSSSARRVGIIVGRTVTWHGRNFYASPMLLPKGGGVIVNVNLNAAPSLSHTRRRSLPRAAARAARGARGLPRRRRPLPPTPRQDAVERRARSRSPTPPSRCAHAAGARLDRQRSRRHRPAVAAPTASTSARTICRWTTSRRIVGRRRDRRRSRPTTRRRSRRPRAPAPTTSPSGRSTAPRPRTPATRRAASIWCGWRPRCTPDARSSPSAASRWSARPR